MQNTYLHYNNGIEEETGIYNNTFLWVNANKKLVLYSQAGKIINTSKCKNNELQEVICQNEAIKDCIDIFYCPMCRS